MENTRRWYIIQTYSGFENSVKEDLERRIESMEMKDYIFQTLIPEEIIEETGKDGKKKEKIKKMFPGYIFVEMIVTDESWFIVRNTPKVTGFLGSSGGGAKPVPLPPEEINELLIKLGKIEKEKVDLSVGETVKVIVGPFAGQYAVIKAIDNDKEEVEASIEIFGRSNDMSFGFKEIKKIV